MLFKVIGIATAVIALIISTILNILYRKQYYQMGVNFIYNYQQNYQTSGINVIQNLISILGNTFFIVAFLVFIHILIYRKFNTIVYIFYIVTNAYFIAVEKQAYQDPRPFFYDTRIQALQWTCPRSYGFPSGHSWISVLLYEPIISDVIGNKGWKKLLLIIIILTGTLIPISRQYLGSHTSDQVTSGALHSISTLILYKYLLQQKIYRLFLNSIKGISLKLILIINSICFLISIAVPFIIYGYNVNNRPIDPLYISQMNTGCNKNYTQPDLQKEAGTAASIIGIIFGFIYGFALTSTDKFKSYILSNYQRSNINPYFYYLHGNWNFQERLLNVIKYLLLYILFGGIFVGVIAYAIPAGFNNFYGTYILQTFGYCLFGIAITCFIPLLMLKLEGIKIDQQQKVTLKQGKTNEHFTPKALGKQENQLKL